jgi:hypothetical protein
VSVVAVVALGLLSFAIGLMAPVATQALGHGRAAFRAVAVGAAARGGATELEQGHWLAASGAVPVGAAILLPPTTTAAGTALVRDVRRVAADLWLGAATATAHDRAGGVLAAARVGLLLRVGRAPPDTTLRARVISRPWVAGIQ